MEYKFTISLNVKMDETDLAIMEIFKKFPARHFHAHQIRTILEYNGIEISTMKLVMKLQFFSYISLISVEKGGRAMRYSLA